MPVWLQFIPDVIKLIGSPITGWVDRKKVALEQKNRIQTAKVNSTIRKIDADVDWDKTMAEGSKDSWKDEYWTIILSIPLILCFIPHLAPYVLDGFEVLNQCPEWYVISVGVAIAAAFGRNEVINWMKKRNK